MDKQTDRQLELAALLMEQRMRKELDEVTYAGRWDQHHSEGSVFTARHRSAVRRRLIAAVPNHKPCLRAVHPAADVLKILSTEIARRRRLRLWEVGAHPYDAIERHTAMQ